MIDVSKMPVDQKIFLRLHLSINLFS